ncbi:hypothetical protein CAC42_1005 [Sphaceloma murrayae]|uniref:Arrestin-like N-terminal domain-containing protein n=1 Tax=Sphaceloma murrayae TaxID=2082308 RepID=A0A2K1R1Q3_9PEZI|nr:hypothetical protein CAC42_1005 [Sphaceloma murrayae]
MTYASSVSSNEANTEKHTVSQKLKKMMENGRPQIKIAIDGAEDSWVMTYSTLDKIEGTVTITSPRRTTVDSLRIDFVGISRTIVEKLSTTSAVSGKTEATHQFLKLSQPIPESAWATGRVLEANKTYNFRFTFVIPQQLLSRICRHDVSSSTVQQEHLTLPPSFGDQSISGRGNTLLDDFAPNMARIRYAIVAELQESDSNGTSSEPIVKAKKVRILPAIDEKPPLTVDNDADYRLRCEKDIRKGILKSRLGHLVVEAAQPRALRVRSHLSSATVPDASVATLNLRFDPVDAHAQPPKLSNLSTKFKITSFYASCARARLPSRHDMAWDYTQGVHNESISLASRCVTNVEWTLHAPSRASSPDLDRRSSTCSSTTSSFERPIPEPSRKYNGGAFYTAQILVPISLPENKAWIPTFHTCLVSRTYALGVHLGVASGTLGGVDLKVPVQISSEGNPEAVKRREEAGGEMEMEMEMGEVGYEALEAEEWFLPRRTGAMGSVGSAGGESPPEYDAFPRAGTRVGVLV